MGNYLATINFTNQGFKKYQDTTKRARKIRADLKKQGVEVQYCFWSMGQFDGFLIFSAPDCATASAAMLSIAAQGNIRLSTSRIFYEQEMEKIVTTGRKASKDI